MQQEYLAEPRLLAISGIDRALDNCRRVLDYARKVGPPVAFVRTVGEAGVFNPATPCARSIEGFEPCRNEMMFERNSPSCYSCELFTAMVNDAFHRDHKVTCLCEASAGGALDEMPAHKADRAVSKISGLYGEVYETIDWIAATLPHKLGTGKNAGG